MEIERSNTLHLSSKELLCLACNMASPEGKEKARKHCEICAVCDLRLESLIAYLKDHSWKKEEDILEGWFRSVLFLKEIEGGLEEGKLLRFPAIFVGQEENQALCAASFDWNRMMRLKLEPDFVFPEFLASMEKLRFMFTRCKEAVYLEFSDVSIDILRQSIAKIQIGKQEFFGREIDGEGGIYLGKERELSKEDMREINIIFYMDG